MASSTPSSTRDVVIIGGGCMAQWLALELVQRRISCAVVDIDPFAAFSSTRNQGWLQSGALYAALGDNSTAQICQKGYDLIQSFATTFVPDALGPAMPCYFLFRDDDELAGFRSRCDSLGIPVLSALSIADLEDEALLHGSFVRCAAQVADCSVNTHALLQAVASVAAGAGAEFWAVPSIYQIHAVPHHEGWRVSAGNARDVECATLVLACGAYIPSLFAHLKPDLELPFRLWQIPTLTMMGNVSKSMLVTPYMRGSPSLIPFVGNQGVGATVCLLQASRLVTSHLDIELPAGHEAVHAKKLADWYPGLKTKIRRSHPIPAHFYHCHTLELPQLSDDPTGHQTHILRSYGVESAGRDNLVVVYPRKFTAAPYVAQLCATRLTALLSNSSLQLGVPAAPRIAVQPYFDIPTHELTCNNQSLEFKPLT